MTNIEKVARDIADALGDNFDYAFESKSDWTKHRGETPAGFRDVNQPYKPDYIAAAIAAMQPAPQEPVAWMYSRDDGSRDLLLDCNGEYARNLLELGATETPLYAGPTPPAGGSDAER